MNTRHFHAIPQNWAEKEGRKFYGRRFHSSGCSVKSGSRPSNSSPGHLQAFPTGTAGPPHSMPSAQQPQERLPRISLHESHGVRAGSGRE